MGHEFKTKNEKELSFDSYKEATHGDVIIRKLDKLPDDFESMQVEKEPVLAYGEVTGHSHRLFRMAESGDIGSSAPHILLKTAPSGKKYIDIKESVVCRHQEHDPRVINPGIYEVEIQRELDPFTEIIRQVQD